MINIWIGTDSQFDANRSAQIYSIMANTHAPLKINFLDLDKLKDIMPRDRDPNQSTDSAFTRWLVPQLANFEGWHLYMDSDIMVRCDLTELWNLRDDSKAVMVVKHPQYELGPTKFNGQPQLNYDKKNWSSVILFNAERCGGLTADQVNSLPGLYLHQFRWIPQELVGELPAKWNHLVGLEPPNPDASIVHWTLGGPWFEEFSNVEFSEEWNTYAVSGRNSFTFTPAAIP